MSPSASPTQRPREDRQEDTQRPQAEQACKECRRRKSRCDRKIPTCFLCRKFQRQCLYEKLAKTPLTRRYLNEVENELRQARELLRQVMPEASNSALNFGTSPNGDHAPSSDNGPGSFPSQTPREFQCISAQSSVRAQQGQGRYENCESPSQARRQQVSVPRSLPRQQTPETSTGRSLGPSGLSLETPPSYSNFEWDERPGNADGERFVDGMASLTSSVHEGGYLGAASGAALLRLTDTRQTDMLGNSNSMKYMTTQHTTSIPFALTSLGQLEPFVEAYFSLYHRSYPIVHEATFRAQFMEVIPRPNGKYWQVLLFVVAATGAFTASSQLTDVDLGLFKAAKDRLSVDMLETGNLILVQALTLISNYMQKRNKPNSGYNYMGLARRIAMGIGLHKEFPTWDASLFTTEMRRRVWHCLYIFDVGAIITFSRPLDFPDEGIDVELPMNVHDLDITLATKKIPQPANETTVYTHLRAQATFHTATSPIYTKLISSPFPPASEMIELDDTLIGHWLTTLPPFFGESVMQEPRFRLCHSILRWRYRNFRILMYRPFLVGRLMARPGWVMGAQDSDEKVELAIKRCLDAAQESLELISTFWTQEPKTIMACWYGLYFLFQAILIPVISLRNDPQAALAMQWREQILQAMPILESMAQLNPTALRCLEKVRSLCGAYLDPSVDEWGQPTEESPLTQLANLYPLMWPTLEMTQIDGVDSILQESTILDFMNQLPRVE